MIRIIGLVLGVLALLGTNAFPYPFLNTTAPNNGTICDGTDMPPDGGSQMCPWINMTITNTSIAVPDYHCHDVYPADLTVINSRYPAYNEAHLHDAKRFFMLRRQIAGDGEIATRVQFQGLPPTEQNITCRLEFILPQLDLQYIQGFNPSFNVYQVEREDDAIATWNTYVGNNDVDVFGRVNGEPEALERTKSVGGVAAINETLCSETMTFQMGLTYNSRDGLPNYWQFLQVQPPAWPVQGFKMVYGC